MRTEVAMKSVVEKLKEALLIVDNRGAEKLALFDDVFPPDTRDKIKHWFHVALPYIIVAVVLTVVVCLYRCCCCCCPSRTVMRLTRPGRIILKIVEAPERLFGWLKSCFKRLFGWLKSCIKRLIGWLKRCFQRLRTLPGRARR